MKICPTVIILRWCWSLMDAFVGAKQELYCSAALTIYWRNEIVRLFFIMKENLFYEL